MSVWEVVPLGSVAAIDRETVNPNGLPDGTRYVGLDGIPSGGGLVHSVDVVSGDLASGKFRFGPEHLLFGKLRPNLAKIAAPDFAGICSTDILPIRPRPGLDRHYLRHYLLQPEIVARTASLATGANLPRLSPSALEAFPLPLPPLAEQQHIADILNRADRLRAMRTEALGCLNSMLESVFVDLFGGSAAVSVHAPREPRWQSVLLTDVARLATGHTPNRKRPDYWDGEIPWISLTDIRELDATVARQTSRTVTQAGIDHSSAVLLPAGTVCFSRTASVGFVTMMGAQMATSQDFVNWVCGPRLNPVYLMFAMIRSRQDLRSLATGSTHRTIYFPTVEQFRVVLPPTSLQDDFARYVRGIWKLREPMEAAADLSDRLFSSLRRRAFSGEL